MNERQPASYIIVGKIVVRHCSVTRDSMGIIVVFPRMIVARSVISRPDGRKTLRDTAYETRDEYIHIDTGMFQLGKTIIQYTKMSLH